MGGKEGGRGYLYQGIVAVLEALGEMIGIGFTLNFQQKVTR